jgi:hypothetical protein
MVEMLIRMDIITNGERILDLKMGRHIHIFVHRFPIIRMDYLFGDLEIIIQIVFLSIYEIIMLIGILKGMVIFGEVKILGILILIDSDLALNDIMFQIDMNGIMR